MQDLTQGSIARHIVTMSAPVLAFMMFQTLYVSVNLYFVAQLGDVAIAGVSAASNATYVISSFTQVLGVGATTLISHAAGRKDWVDANLVFNQAVMLSLVCGVLVLMIGYGFAGVFLQSLAADEATVASGMEYFRWFMPSMAAQFALSAIAAALRGTGVVRPTMIVYAGTLMVNAALAPIFIAGWFTGHPMGVAGAGLASSVAVVIAVVFLWGYFYRSTHGVTVNARSLRPSLPQWKRILNIGLPAGAEMALMFISMAVIFRLIRHFGAAAQAGFGVGSRVMQVLLVPVMAISFAVAPIVGQNFGAGNGLRVKQTFRTAAFLSLVIMAIITLILQAYPDVLVKAFTKEEGAIVAGAMFLQLVSFGFVSRSLVYVCSSAFQGLGDTRPSLASSGISLVVFAVLAIWLSGRPDFRIEHVWYLWSAAVTLQAVVSMVLLRIAFSRRLISSRNEMPAKHGDLSNAAQSVQN